MATPKNDFSHLEQTRTIGDFTYVVQPLGFRASRKGLMRLTAKLGPAVAALALAGTTQLTKIVANGTDANVANAVIVQSFAKLVTDLTDEDLQFFQDLFTPCTKIEIDQANGPQPQTVATLEAHFTHKLDDYFMWLVFCIEVNYRDFIAGAWKKASALRPAQVAQGQSAFASTSLSTPEASQTGPNTDS